MSDRDYQGMALPRDAYHAERMYWKNNPPARRAGMLTTREVAAALGVGFKAIQARARRGSLLVAYRENGQLFFRESYIADVQLRDQQRKAMK